MNKYLVVVFLASVAFVLNGCTSNPKNDSGANSSVNTVGDSSGLPIDSTLYAAIKFDEEEFSFGEVEQGQVLTHTFAFTNTGKGNLLIQQAIASCGCTVPQWPKDAIAPGRKGNITVEFNSKNITGQVKKTITITANTLPPTTQVAFTCSINEPK